MKHSYKPRDTLKLGPSIHIIQLELDLLAHSRNNELSPQTTDELKAQFKELETTHTQLLIETLKLFQDVDGLPYNWNLKSITQEITDITGVLANLYGWSFYIMGMNTRGRKEFKKRVTRYKQHLRRLNILLDRLETKSAPLRFRERMKPRGLYTLNMNNILASIEGSDQDTEPATIKPGVMCATSNTTIKRNC